MKELKDSIKALEKAQTNLMVRMQTTNMAHIKSSMNPEQLKVALDEIITKRGGGVLWSISAWCEGVGTNRGVTNFGMLFINVMGRPIYELMGLHTTIADIHAISAKRSNG
eukprot:61611-Pyramimonas_sp.AAC.1